MEVREWFERGRKIDRELKQLRIAKDKAFLQAVNTVSHTGDENTHTNSKNSTELKFVRYSDYSLKIEQSEKQLELHREKMLETINEIENTNYRAVLIARYINCGTWEQISEDMNISARQIYRIHEKALREIKRRGIIPRPNMF